MSVSNTLHLQSRLCSSINHNAFPCSKECHWHYLLRLYRSQNSLPILMAFGFQKKKKEVMVAFSRQWANTSMFSSKVIRVFACSHFERSQSFQEWNREEIWQKDVQLCSWVGLCFLAANNSTLDNAQKHHFLQGSQEMQCQKNTN